MRRGIGPDQSSRCRGGEKGGDSGCILKTKHAGFVNILSVECAEKTRVGMILQYWGPEAQEQ